MIRSVRRLLPHEVELRLRQQKKLLLLKLNKNKLDDYEMDKLETASGLEPRPILFAGYQKSGNTWLRFLIFNYFNIKLNNSQDTLTYSELNQIYQPDVIGVKQGRTIDKYIREVNGTKNGYPHLFRTHSIYKKPYSVFENTIHITRNPLDTLVSAYHYHIKNRKKDTPPEYPFKEIDSYVSYHFPSWLYHLNTYLSRENILHVTYEDLQRNPDDELRKVLDYLGEERIDPGALQKSIEFSSFGSIKQMGREKGETHGMAPKETYTGEFTRKGKVGGYKEELKPETIKKVKKRLQQTGLNIYGEF